MKKILISDSNKSSLVMISEIFKEKFPGIQIFTAQTLESIKKSTHKIKDFDTFILDIELMEQQDFQFLLTLNNDFKKLIILTSIQESSQFQYFFKKLKNKKSGFAFLKKPLHPKVLDAICAYYNENKKILTSSLDSEILGYAIFQNKNNSKKKQKFFPISLQECSLTGIKIRLKLDMGDTQLKKFFLSVKEGKKLKIYLPDLFYISIKQNLINSEKLKNLQFEKIEENFKFVVEGKIVESEIIENSTDILMWIELNSILFAKQIFEAAERSKTPHIPQSLSQLYY